MRGRPTLLDMWGRKGITVTSLSASQTHNARYLVYAKATYYENSVRVFIFNKPFVATEQGYELPARPSHAPCEDDEPEIPYETNEERSIRRARKTMKDYVLCNHFDIFATFTIGTDRYNDERSIKRMLTWLKNQRNRNGKFRYIVVTERHKDGALHFHALIGGYTGNLAYAINPNSGGYISDKRGDFVRNFSEYKLGNNTAKIIDNKAGSTKTAYYLQKYVGKDLTASFGKKRYWVSRGLKKPAVEQNPEPFYKQIDTPLHWVVDHGTILEFEYGLNPVTDMFIEAHRT